METGEEKGPWTLSGLGSGWSSREVKSTVNLSGFGQLWSMCTHLAGEGHREDYGVRSVPESILTCAHRLCWDLRAACMLGSEQAEVPWGEMGL